MQLNILWTGREYYSLENCLVDITAAGAEINSTIIGKYGEKIYQVDYQIKINENWETLFLHLKTQYSSRREDLIFESDGRGNWIMNGRQADQFKGCVDIDIALSPLTNTLPIRRLKLSDGEEQEIQVIYFNILEQEIGTARQKYIRLSNTVYQYENIPNDFEAKIIVDEYGLVVDYPALFVRTTALETNFA